MKIRKRRERGVGTVVGATIFILIVLIAFSTLLVIFSVNNDYNRIVSEMNEFDIARLSESVSIDTAKFLATRAFYRSNTGSNTLNSVKNKVWTGSSWAVENEMPVAANPASQIRWVRSVQSPLSSRDQEAIVATLSDNGSIDAYVWGGTAWTVFQALGNVGTSENAYRSFDIAYEKSSGKAVLVYAVTSTDAAKDLAYRIWDGSSWSAESYIDDTGHASDIQYRWVALASYPLTTGRTNEIALLAMDATNSDVNAWIWNGSSWANNFELSTNVARLTEEDLAIAYEQQSGNLMVAAAQQQSSSTADSDFKDGASVAVPTTRGLLDSLATALPAGNNLVVAAVQFDNTAGAARRLVAGDLELRRGTGTADALISETQFEIRVAASGAVGDGMFAVLIGRDASAPSSPTYGVFAAADATGLNAEAKILIINGLAAADSVFGDGASTAVSTGATTLISQTTSLPAASASFPNIIVATIQYDSVSGRMVGTNGDTRLLRSGTVLATNQFEFRTPNNGSPDGVYVILVARDTTAPANPTYSVDTLNDDASNTVNAEAKILVFRGLSANSVDSGSVAIGTTRTVIGSTGTTFASGDDVVIGTIQLNAQGATRTIASNGDDIRLTGDAGASSNQFAHTVAQSGNDGAGPYQGFVRKVTTTSANPSYEGAATSPAAAGLNAELKLVAVHVKDAGAPLDYNLFTGSWGTTSTITMPNQPRWLKLGVDPTSNRLMLLSIDPVPQVTTRQWTGSAWDASVNHGSTSTSVTRPADFAWEPTGSRGLLVWGGTTAGTLSYKTFTAPSTFGGVNTITAAGTQSWVQLETSPVDSATLKILGAMLNSNIDTGALKWDGATLTNLGDSALTADAGTTSYESFDVGFQTSNLTGVRLKLTNSGPEASRLVSLWIVNATGATRLDQDISLRSGETQEVFTSYSWGKGQYTFREVTERGRITVSVVDVS